MKTIIVEGDPVAAIAAEIGARIARNPALTMTLPTGRTFAPVYARWRTGGTRFPDVRAVQLDEYLDLPDDDPRRFAAVLDDALFAAGVFDRGRALMLAPDSLGLAARAAAHEAAIDRAGGLDLALLGLGSNGHVAFNEPGSPADSGTRAVALTPETRAGAAGDFPDRPVPARAITLGVGSLRAARSVLIVALGTGKAGPVAACRHGPIDPACPASLFRDHPDATLLIDAAAAGPGPAAAPQAGADAR